MNFELANSMKRGISLLPYPVVLDWRWDEAARGRSSAATTVNYNRLYNCPATHTHTLEPKTRFE